MQASLEEDVQCRDEISDTVASSSECGPLIHYPQNLLFPQEFMGNLIFFFFKCMRNLVVLSMCYIPLAFLEQLPVWLTDYKTISFLVVTDAEVKAQLF